MKISSFCFAFAMVTFSSIQSQINVLSSFKDLDGLGDYSCFEVLSDQLQEVRVVGMGESTHGTSEFFSTRLKMFRYLVEQQQFTTLYLEDEYATCLAINRYIHGQNGSSEDLVSQLSNWPWKTLEFVEVVEWMRQYNEEHPQQQVHIVGVDMQDFQPAFLALDQLLTKNGALSVLAKDQAKMNVNRSLLNEEQLEKIDSLIAKAKVLVESTEMNAKDKWECETLIRHLVQTRKASEGYERSYRDVQMAKNLLRDLNVSPDRKGFYWAHNGHVCNLNYTRNKRTATVYWAGGKLREELGEGYFVVIQDFAQGSFNAYHLKANDLDKEDIQNYNLGPVEMGYASEKFFAYGHNSGNQSQLMTVGLLKPRKKYILFHSVGAEYTPPSMGGSKVRGYIGLEPHYYDCVLLIAKSSPSHLLSK